MKSKENTLKSSELNPEKRAAVDLIMTITTAAAEVAMMDTLEVEVLVVVEAVAVEEDTVAEEEAMITREDLNLPMEII
jgi:hypothetical protein